MKIKQAIFNKIHQSNLVYNTCWEDPRCDRKLLDLQADSKVVMITSAGCNALDYLLDTPATIDCVDLNPRQNALLELKKTLLSKGSHEALFGFFGQGKYPRARTIFEDLLRRELDAPHARYWAGHIRYFEGNGARKSFYYRGSSGLVAFMLRNMIAADGKALRLTRQLLDSDSLDMQREVYQALEPRLFRKPVMRLIDGHLTQSLLGVPASQQKMARELYPREGMAGYIKACFRHVFTDLPLDDNYFWKLYFNGQYTANCCPNYLDSAHFEHLRANTQRITTHTKSISQFLLDNPGQYTHFVLLDHQDWLANHLPKALEEEWQLILANSAPGAKYLLRSAGATVDFIPKHIAEQVSFEKELTQKQHRLDRVGTYASVHLGILKENIA